MIKFKFKEKFPPSVLITLSHFFPFEIQAFSHSAKLKFNQNCFLWGKI